MVGAALVGVCSCKRKNCFCKNLNTDLKQKLHVKPNTESCVTLKLHKLTHISVSSSNVGPVLAAKTGPTVGYITTGFEIISEHCFTSSKFCCPLFELPETNDFVVFF